jgi:hypothetical protein
MSTSLPTLSMTISALHACATVRPRDTGNRPNEEAWAPVPRVVDMLRTHDKQLRKALSFLEKGDAKCVEKARQILDDVLVGPHERAFKAEIGVGE